MGSDIKFLGLSLFQNLSIKILASFIIILLTLLNYRGVHFAEKLSSVLTYAMLAGIIVFVVIGFSSEKGSVHNLTTTTTVANTTVPQGWYFIKALFIASLGAFWGYEGWNNIAYIGEEVKNPKKNQTLFKWR